MRKGVAWSFNFKLSEGQLCGILSFHSLPTITFSLSLTPLTTLHPLSSHSRPSLLQSNAGRSSTPPPPLRLRQTPPHNRRARIQRLPPSHNLITFIQLHLHRTSDFERAYSRPNAALSMQDPILQSSLRRRLEQFPEIPRAEVWHQREACARDVLVH